ncbi:FecR family protein [Pedobacter steynii]
MEYQEAKQLLQKYRENACTEEELAMLESWYLKYESEGLEKLTLEQWALIEQTEAPKVKKAYKLWPRIAAAAAILLVAGTGVFFYTNTLRHPDAGQDPAIVNQNDVAPGHNGATLTLANGKKIRLSDASQGELAKEGGVVISKTADGQIIYEINDNTSRHPELVSGSQNNTLTTAKGETFQIKLPDGTSVWLNAASTLTYPASFASLKQRNVELSGEGYFEVAKDKTKPFIVKTEKQEVQVLGTHFNINSYADEPNTKTTLLEGSVKVSALDITGRHPELVSGPRTDKSAAQVLTPNQQATLTTTGITVKNVEPEDAIAWKNGLFMFDSESLESIMKK